jgi:hypothetical protein
VSRARRVTSTSASRAGLTPWRSRGLRKLWAVCIEIIIMSDPSANSRYPANRAWSEVYGVLRLLQSFLAQGLSSRVTERIIKSTYP